ncbi:MAG TPA: tRNA (adenosine(37)-N6)-dimethylallyltransferase MiaA [Polyangiaceae bacterium]|nr:tRNA (adenosine(37)-N6)-dimethylallyltransferase MiaA [Polyangiaceae bacterium]
MRRLDVAPPEEGEVLAVVGPTASGKTELALRLAEAFGGEIVGADSVQIYRRFDAGSGKPTAEERARAPYHLVDVADAREPFDAARFATLAEGLLGEVRARGRVPIVCGGTFLWLKALLFGLAEGAPSSPELRARHRAIAEREGRAALHARLGEVDPASAARLAPNDFVRVSRALEVFELSGRRLSDVQAAHGFRAPRHRARLVGVLRSRDELDARISARTRAFLSAGWVDEVRALEAEGYGETRPMQSVGYRQVLEHVRGGLPLGELSTAVDRATRIFVRRQRTWLRDQPVHWLPPSAFDAA